MPKGSNKPIKIMMVAGEHSGDILAAGLINRLKNKFSNITFSGIGGPRMTAEGFESYYPMSKLSVFGLFEVLRHLPELLGIRKALRERILIEKPDVFIGIDAPDFNLNLERDLHQQGIKTVHYVSPTVWAWRPKRIKKLIGSLDALLCIFPFEEAYFEQTLVPAHFIGHPLADKLNDSLGKLNARNQLKISNDAHVLVVMPGSRLGELNRHSELFIRAARLCADKIPGLKVLVPMPDEATASLFKEFHQSSGIDIDLDVRVTESTTLIEASDLALVASGTATLEVMLLQKPMVVAYKLSPLSTWVFKTFDLLKAPFVSMPNLIADKPLVKELLHEKATSESMAAELLRLYNQPNETEFMINEFAKMKNLLTRDANEQSAQIVSTVIQGES